jgi:hypothetical protein
LDFEFDFWNLGFGIWDLGFGIWVWNLEFGIWNLGFGIWVLEFAHRSFFINIKSTPDFLKHQHIKNCLYHNCKKTTRLKPVVWIVHIKLGH